MPRILLLIALIWVLYIVIKHFIANNITNQASTKNNAESEKIVACHHCGLHVPESESRLMGDVTVCNNPNCHKQP